MTRPPARCNACQVNRVAWVKPRVDYCYECLPGGPFTPPACRGCGLEKYFSDGLCEKCHPGGPLYLGSCRDCMAWGVYRAHSWLCWSCRWWRTHCPLDDCQYCARTTPVSRPFPWRTLSLKPQALREDRILQEIHATGGDIRRICDLFGLTVETAQRYALTLAHPDLTRTHVPVPRAQDNK